MKLALELMAQLSIRWPWKPANGIRNHGTYELLNLSEEVISKAVRRLIGQEEEYVMNSHQCHFLARRLLQTKDTLEIYHPLLLELDKRALPALQELHQALVNAGRLILSSCITDTEWLRAVIEQGDMKETFSSLLYEVQWHKFVLHKILVDNFWVSRIMIQPEMDFKEVTEQDNLGLSFAVTEDKSLLKSHLMSVIPTPDDSVEGALAHQLLRKMDLVDDQLTSVSSEGSHQVLNNEESSSSAVLATSSSLNLLFLEPQNLNERGTLLGGGSFAEVRETTLLGGKYAVKIFEEHHTHSFHQEVEALQGLGHHPHIVHLLCYSKNESNCFLIMEKMGMDLSKFLKGRKGTGIDHVEAVGLMLQIAEGVRYIHKNRMAHRDLKPGNVLVNVDDNTRARSVKIADFGLTKTKNASEAKSDHTLNTGTVKYMAPEVIKVTGVIKAPEIIGDPDRSPELIPKKADVYSFAIMCSEILTIESPFGDLGNNEVKKHVKGPQGPMSRPSLPADCPERLASLIRRCWDEECCARPDFDDICVELRDIKGTLLRGDQQVLAQTNDASIECGSLSWQKRQEFKLPSSRSFSKRRLSEQLRRRTWPSKTWNCPVVLVLPILVFLLLSLVAAFYRTKQRQVPIWEHNLDHCQGRSQYHDGAASMESIRQGPWGRKEPNKITGYFDHKADSIKSIMIKYDQTPPRIGLMEVEYVNHDRGEFKKRYCWDTIGSKVIKMNFQPNEHIRRVSGSFALYFIDVRKRKVGLYSVVSLTFHTNLRSHGPFGDEVGERFTSGTGKVIGFFGAAGVLLDKLGVWIIPDGQFHGNQSVLIEQ